VDSLVPASQAFARSTFHSLPQPAAQPQSSAVHHYTTRTYNSAARPPGLPLPALVSRTARVPVAATALNRSAPQFCWLPLQTRLALARGLVRLILTFSSAGHDAITFASRVKREALVGARSSPFLAQAVSTAGSPIALAGRASCAAAVALVAAATRNVIDIPHL